MSEQYRFEWTDSNQCKLFELKDDAYFFIGAFSGHNEDEIIEKMMSMREFYLTAP